MAGEGAVLLQRCRGDDVVCVRVSRNGAVVDGSRRRLCQISALTIEVRCYRCRKNGSACAGGWE